MIYCVGVRNKGEKDYFPLDETATSDAEDLRLHLENAVLKFGKSKPGALELSLMEQDSKKKFKPISVQDVSLAFMTAFEAKHALVDSYVEKRLSQEEHKKLSKSLSASPAAMGSLQKIQTLLTLFKASPLMVASTIARRRKKYKDIVSPKNIPSGMDGVFGDEELFRRLRDDVLKKGKTDDDTNDFLKRRKNNDR